MFSPALIAGLLLGLSQIPSSLAQPLNGSFIVTHIASNYFPNAKGDLTPFDVDVQFTGFNGSTKSWLTSLDPASGSTDEEKAELITAAAYAKPFNAHDPDMVEDVNALLAAVAGNTTTTIQKRDSFTVSTAHAVVWSDCSAYFSCVSGVDCRFSLGIGQAPRSQCQQNGASNCCISWSTYNVQAGFFATTWNSCNSGVAASGYSSASCQGHGSSDQGGDVCLSNRASGCT